MFKTAMQSGRITVNNPSIWRPILAIQDAAAAYVRAVEAAPSVSGTFNILSENTTLGALADQVSATLQRNLDLEPELEILHKADVRNYKVSGDRARVQLGFKPSKVKRPPYSILAHERLESLGILTMRPWQKALAEYVGSLDAAEGHAY